MQRLLCTRCGDSIHPDTAKQNNGLCVPCVRGNQLTIEQRKENHRKEREAERARLESPEWKYWSSLADRVYHTPRGFDALSKGDRFYYLINTLGAEVYNDGLEQFFSDTTGDLYYETVDALIELDERVILELLEEAKMILFSSSTVPKSHIARRNLMVTSSENHPEYHEANRKLEELDKRFYANGENITRLLEKLADRYGLYGSA